MSVVNGEALRIPSSTFTEGIAILSRRVTAIRLVERRNGCCKLGPIGQLHPGRVELCGPGYNERTVKVRLDNNCYFVFRDDLTQP